MITIMIPALNEEKNLKNTVHNVLDSLQKSGNLKNEIIIVNDGSTDKTKEIAKKLEQKHSNILVIHHESNKGIGYSLREVINVAKYPKFMIIPGDNDLSKEQMVSMFKNYNKADLIIAYFLNKELRGRRRNVISTLFNTIYMITFGVFVQYINGPCIYPIKKLKKIELKSNRFSIVVETTIKLLLSGCTYHEIGGYLKNGNTGSTSLSFKTLWDVVKCYFRLIWEIKVKKKKYYYKKPVRVY